MASLIHFQASKVNGEPSQTSDKDPSLSGEGKAALSLPGCSKMRATFLY